MSVIERVLDETNTKSEVIALVRNEINFSYQYFAMLVLSVVISTFGLLLGNTAIIIGAMILSPMMWPMIGLGLGVVDSRRHLFINSFMLLITSIAISIFIAYVISLISPFTEINTEIALRMNPTFFDLIIALAAGFAAVLIIIWPKYSNSLAGVAVAASLLPPICVTGIGLALGSTKVAYGSFVLFLTNMASIIFVGIAIFALLGYYKKTDEKEVRKVEYSLLTSFLLILILSFQLIFSLSKIMYENDAKNIIRTTMNSELNKISSEIVVDGLVVNALTRSNESIDVEANIRVPSGTAITVSQKNKIVEEVSAKIGKEVNLELKIVPILKVVSNTDDKERERARISTLIEEQLTEKFQELSDLVLLDAVSVSEIKDSEISRYDVVADVRIPSSVEMTSEYKEELTFALIKKINRPIVLHLNIIEYSPL